MTRCIVTVHEGVATVELRKAPLNTFDSALRDELRTVIQSLRTSDVRAVVITGGTRAFSAGADVAELAVQLDIFRWNALLQDTVDLIANLPMPVVAAVSGYALGGGFELALACDYRIGDGTAQLGLPEVDLGIIPGAGGTQRLARLVGGAQAKHLIMTGRRLSATEALRLGVLDELATDTTAVARATEYARELSARPAAAIQAVKQAVNNGLDVSLATGLALERALLATVFHTPDRGELMATFLRRKGSAVQEGNR